MTPTVGRHRRLRGTNRNLHVRGDRFQLVQDENARLPELRDSGRYLNELMNETLVEPKLDIDEHGQDLPIARTWKWGDHQSSVAKP
jgi:phosphoketolase